MTDLSPLAAADAAKRRRDIGGEIGALIAGADDLARQPWGPLRAGDVVLTYLPPCGDIPAYGQTYLAVDDETDIDGHAMMREVSRTDELCAETGLAQFYELWFEAGPHALVVIRAGAVVHGTPARVVSA
jgi:hypothetical protein